MNTDEIKKELKSMIVERLSLKISPDEISDDKPLFRQRGESEEGLNLDSVEGLEIVVGIEHHFNVIIEEGEYWKEFYSINTLADWVQTLLNEKEKSNV